MKWHPRRLRVLQAALFMLAAAQPAWGTEATWDVVVYGGTSAGVVAAVEAARLGHSVVLVAPEQHLGGMTASGLGETDTGNAATIGGLAREFYRRIHTYYSLDAHWTQEPKSGYSYYSPTQDIMLRFEPKAAETVFEGLIQEAGVPVMRGERLNRSSGVARQGTDISCIATESGSAFCGKTFIDASYEGDLMAAAGVSYATGREPNSRYGERLNGVQKARATAHQFTVEVDPWVVPGDPTSGLLPGIGEAEPGADGSGDQAIQAYNFRLCLTQSPANQVSFSEPAGYDPLRYELLLRSFEAGDTTFPLHNGMMPNLKTDTNNLGAFSTDGVGMNRGYPEADYAAREAIQLDYELYTRGFLWTLATNPRVPQEVRSEISQWGLCADEYGDHGNWPRQLYIREARRMVSDYVVTEADCLGGKAAADSIGLGSYGMDSHNVQRYVDQAGHVRNEGDVEVPSFGPYPIPYRAIVPSKGQASNLLVPVALSASHIAYGSIRMEPVFMVLAQSAAVAAGLAVETGAAVQDVDVAALQTRLRSRGQILESPIFRDVPENHWAASAIRTLYASHLTSGCGPGLFCPDATVTRDQTAVLLERAMRYQGPFAQAYAPAVTTVLFGDVTKAHWAAPWIGQLSLDGITSGCGPGIFCPSRGVTRAEMAVFLERSRVWPKAPSVLPATGKVFADVGKTHWAAAWIEQLSRDGLTQGCGGGKFCPEKTLTRAEMAVFLVRTFRLR